MNITRDTANKLGIIFIIFEMMPRFTYILCIEPKFNVIMCIYFERWIVDCIFKHEQMLTQTLLDSCYPNLSSRLSAWFSSNCCNLIVRWYCLYFASKNVPLQTNLTIFALDSLIDRYHFEIWEGLFCELSQNWLAITNIVIQIQAADKKVCSYCLIFAPSQR